MSIEIKAYSTKAETILPFMGEGPLWFGVELEVEFNRKKNDTAAAPQDHVDKLLNTPKPFTIFKADSSLTDGMEIVTAPAIRSVHQERWKPFFEGVKELPFIEARPSCGLHIHYTRNGVTDETNGKLLEFITEPANKPFIVKIAGRSSPSAAALAKKRHEAVNHNCSTAGCHHYPGNGGEPLYYTPAHKELVTGHHDAVNCSNKKTIEVRIFASTLKAEQFFGRLDFVAAALKFCARRNYKELTTEHFLARMKMPYYQRNFPALIKMLQSLNYLSADGSIKADA
jgi:hypothetical protein